jgi:hypothetical protein
MPQWTGEEDLGGILTSSPAACSWGSNRIDVFYPGLNDNLLHKSWDGQSWRPEEGLRGRILTSSPAACSWGSNRIDVFYRGLNDHLWHRAYA